MKEQIRKQVRAGQRSWGIGNVSTTKDKQEACEYVEMILNVLQEEFGANIPQVYFSSYVD